MDDALSWALWLGPPAAIVTGAGLAAGAAFTRGRLRGWWLSCLLVGLGVVAVLAIIGGVLTRESDVEAGHAFEGLLFAAVMVLVGLAVSYGVGWLTAKLPGGAGIAATVFAWALLMAPASAGAFGVAFVIADAMNCPPDAYECPL